MEAETQEKVDTQETTETAVDQAQQTEGTEATEQGDAQNRIQQLTRELDAEKESKDLLQQNIALMRANTPQQPQVEQFDIFKHVGLDPEDPEDMPNQKQLKAIVGHIQGRYRDEISQLRFKIDHPDYSEIVGTEEQLRAGQFAEPIKQAIKANPALIATIQASAQPQMAAYSIAKLYQQNKAKEQQITKTETQDVIDQAVKNATRVKTSANAKGGTALTGENRYSDAHMTDEEFVALTIKNGANF